jgi:DNA topoisomerase-2
MEEFYTYRLHFYHERKKHLLAEMNQQLAKLTNQAKFIMMIINGELVVSKKKKSVLVAELQKLNFKRFPKVVDARKEGEFEAVVEQDNDESDDAETAAGASDYDYLLGMAIWSLTQERVDKLNQQIGDKEDEITALTKKSATDIWEEDLVALLAEWETQLREEADRVKKVRSKGRRASAKLGIGGKGKKRKADDSDASDSEFAVKKPKTATARLKEGLLGKPESKAAGRYALVNGIEQKPVVVPANQMSLDGAFDEVKPMVAPKETALSKLVKAKPAAPAPKPAAKPAPKKKMKVESEDEDPSEDVFSAVAKEAASKPAASRAGRAAAQRTKKYAGFDSDEASSSEDNDRLGDVSTMVKGIGGNTSEGATRLYHPPSASRPSSAHGIKPKPKKAINVDISEDETDWAALAQNSPQKATHHTALSEDDDDDMVIDDKPPPKPAVKAAPKAKPAPKPKESAALKPKKAPAPSVAPAIPKTLSPAAKAYAQKHAKPGVQATKPGALKPAASKAVKKKTVDSDDDDDVDALANDILSEEDSPVKPAARPSRRAAAAPKSKYVVEDDEDEDEDEESEADFDDDESD